jgi:hypothetical protein
MLGQEGFWNHPLQKVEVCHYYSYFILLEAFSGLETGVDIFSAMGQL